MCSLFAYIVEFGGNYSLMCVKLVYFTIIMSYCK
jgi:hypothetical protein